MNLRTSPFLYLTFVIAMCAATWAGTDPGGGSQIFEIVSTNLNPNSFEVTLRATLPNDRLYNVEAHDGSNPDINATWIVIAEHLTSTGQVFTFVDSVGPLTTNGRTYRLTVPGPPDIPSANEIFVGYPFLENPSIIYYQDDVELDDNNRIKKLEFDLGKKAKASNQYFDNDNTFVRYLINDKPPYFKNSSFTFIKNRNLPPTRRVENYIRTIKGLTLLVDFEDCPASIDFKSRYDKILNNVVFDKNSRPYSLPAYYKKVSENKFKISFDTTRVFRAKYNFNYYHQYGKNNKLGDRTDFGRHILVMEVLEQLKKEGFDFSVYTKEERKGKDEITALMIATTHPKEFPKGFGSSRRSIKKNLGIRYKINEGLYVDEYCGGTTRFDLIHELAHLLLRWPDLYGGKYGLRDKTSVMSIMSGHRSDAPDPYSLYVLGWLKAINLYGKKGIWSIDSKNINDAYIYYDTDKPDEFFFITAITKDLGFKNKYPDEGIAIWRINRNGLNRHFPDTNLEVELIHANGKNDDFTPGGILFKPNKLNIFNSLTIPSSSWKYNNENKKSGLRIRVISKENHIYKFKTE